MMPTVLREHGFKVRIYTKDHDPMHVHVERGDGVAAIFLED